MHLLLSLFEKYSTVTMLYSLLFIPNCLCEDVVSGVIWKNNKDGTFHIYVNKIPFKSAGTKDMEKQHMAFKAWLLSTIAIAIIFCFCCVCWKFYMKGSFKRPSLNRTVVSPPSRTFVTLQINQNVNTGLENLSTRTGNTNSRGLVNLSFANNTGDPVTVARPNLHDPLPAASAELYDRPPAYSAIVSANFDNDKQRSSLHSQVRESHKVETPPPDYISVAPFDDSMRTTNNVTDSQRS